MNAPENVVGSPELSRRDFITSTGSALVIGIVLQGGSGRAMAAQSVAAFKPNAFLRLTPDGRVTVLCGYAEMGQGVLTAIPMLVAEELDADWKHVHVEQAPTDKAYTNPMFGMQGTGGSTTVRANWLPLRKAGAAARTMLVGAAAKHWKLEASTLRTASGRVIAPDGRTLSYGELVTSAAKQPVPSDVVLKDSKDFKILGQPLKRLDSAAKVRGAAQFGMDAHLPGMLVAVMARAPLPGAKPVKVNDTKTKAVKGVHQVITIPHGVAVLASGYWAAKKGRDALEIEWDLGELAGLSTEKVSAILREGAENADKVAFHKGDIGALSPGAGASASGGAAGARVVEALYEAPYLAHACMEPMNCTAWVKAESVDVWVGTQAQGPTQGILAQVAGVKPEKVTVHEMLLGGGFGRRFAPDFTVDATLLSKQSGKPVKLIYSREDDMAAGYYRPAAAARFSTVLDHEGVPTTLKVGISGASITVGAGFGKLPDNGVDAQAVEGIADQPYDIANQHIAYGRREPGPQVWFWRSVGSSQNCFFIESFMDELAAAANKDPFEYRRALLTQQPRCKGVLEAAAEKAGWGQPMPAGRFRGIALAMSFGSYVAEVAEVSVSDDGSVKIHRVVAVVDCGMIVNPEIIRRQIEGAIVYGLSAALYGKITFKDGRVEQGNFNDYPILRMSEMPTVEVHILPSTEAPGGIGEPGTPPIAPALTNAIFAATGKRLRSLPIDTALLKKG